MNFFIFNLLFAASCMPALLFLGIGPVAFSLSLALSRASSGLKAKLAFILAILSLLALIYISVAWSAFSVALAHRYMNRPEVTWDYLYLLVGLVWCVALVRYWVRAAMESSARAVEKDPELGILAHGGTAIAVNVVNPVVVFGYIGFAIWPHLMSVPYGWGLALLGLGA